MNSIDMHWREVLLLKNGRKTQARREVDTKVPIGFQPSNLRTLFGPEGEVRGHGFINDYNVYVMCPYTKGEVIYVSEACFTSKKDKDNNFIQDPPVIYRADGAKRDDRYPNIRTKGNMPKWAARFFLWVNEVRIERLQDITRGDIRREGLSLPPSPTFSPTKKWSELHREFMIHWKKITNNKTSQWYDNPWVWVIEFTFVSRKWVQKHTTYNL
jgi:hypothetical protein